MIRKLFIQNYAIIDELEIEFKPGLNIITGETGAGKSILLGALSLLLGQRADSSVLKNKEKSCIIEAELDVRDYDLANFFNNNDIDSEEVTIVRRQLSDNGKSRAFINEIPVNLNLLKELGERLIDIHSQHQNLLLGNSRFQLDVLDSLALSKDILLDYKNDYEHYRRLKEELNKLEELARNAGSDLDYLTHQLNELKVATLKPGELPELEAQQTKLTHATDIKAALLQSYATLSADENSIISKVKEMEVYLRRVSSFYPQIEGLIERLENCRIELKDVSDELDSMNSAVEVDDEQQTAVNRRIDLIYGLMAKNRVGTYDELIKLRDTLEAKVNEIEKLDFNLDDKRKELKQAETVLLQKAENISRLRQKSVPAIEKYISEMLQQLGIKHATFRVEISRFSDFQPWGIDRVTFYFSANRDVAPQELSRVASGGELSRLMLSLKSLLVRSSGLPTIIFDEIDTGVSGEIADRMGSIIFTLAKGMQVINITHLPQIAAKGSTHFLVHKSTANSTPGIKLLSPDERVIEIAKMLSGEKVTDAALLNARELLGSNVGSN